MIEARLTTGICILALAISSACQSVRPSEATIAADGRLIRVRVATRAPEEILRQVGVSLEPSTLITNLSHRVDSRTPVPRDQAIALQVHRAIRVLVNGDPLITTAQSVGEALNSAGIPLYLTDYLDPPPDSRLQDGLKITHVASQPIRLALGGGQVTLRAVRLPTGAALAEGGHPAIGLDSTSPAWNDPLPMDDSLILTRVSEAIVIVQQPMPYGSTTQDSADLEIGAEQVLEAGHSGLSITRTRIRYEDGVEVARQVEPQAVIRPPRDRVVLRGTKIVEKTAIINGQTITYWRVMQMYATVYSPCNSATGSGACSSGTASGLRAGKGVVAVDPALYAYLNGQRLYIPGYGYAVVGDVGGGYIVEKNLGISRYKWIDLGFDDNNIQDMTGWITVYFLSPIPASIPDVLK